MVCALIGIELGSAPIGGTARQSVAGRTGLGARPDTLGEVPREMAVLAGSLNRRLYDRRHEPPVGRA